MDEYGDGHRYFLQYITAKRILTASEVKSTYQLCCEKFNVSQGTDLRSFVMSINQRIVPIGLSIKKYLQEDSHSNTHCFVLVNTWNNDATRHASPFTQQEFSFLRRIIDAIVMEGGSVSETLAINLSSQAEPRMKLSDGEAFIERLIKSQWLVKNDDEDSISMSVLAMAELQPYLEETYVDSIPKCCLCKLITYKGYDCPSCQSTVHRSCAQAFWSESKSHVCPQVDCKVRWTHIEFNPPVKRLRS